MSGDVLWLAMLFLLVATLYSSVGHAGASGYLAAMALIGLAPEQMRPTALARLLRASVAKVRPSAAATPSQSADTPFNDRLIATTSAVL